MKGLFKNLFYLFLPIILGSIVGLITNTNMDDIVSPKLTPPSFLFPIVWTVIYLLMGISYFIIKKYRNTYDESKVYYTQLIVNLLWSFIFFTFKLYFISVIWIIILDILVIYMIYLFYNKNKIAGYLNILYLAWILFATYLTISICILN